MTVQICRHGPLILTLLLAGLASARSAEPEPGAARPRVEFGAEIWRLRPAVSAVQAAASTSARDPRAKPVTEIPAARRNVRVVYPALTEAR